MHKKTIFIIFIGVILVVVAFILFFNLKLIGNNQISCTMEAKICPDGSTVGRSGPKCEFSPCP